MTTSTSQATAIERLTAAYADPVVDPSAAAWQRLVADEAFETKPVAVVEFTRVRDAGASAGYDAFVDALATAVGDVGGEMVSVNDTFMPGLEGLEGHEGGVSWVATFPSAKAYVDALLDERVVAAAAKRRGAIAEATVLLGENKLPEMVKHLPPNEPASSFPSGRVTGRSAAAVVDDLLALYPSGGADPTKNTLRAMVEYEGFADQRVHFINLYRFNDAPGGGATALGEYNQKATPAVLAHGARPKVLVDVSHHLVGAVAWDRFILVCWPSLAVFTDLRLDPAYFEAQKDRVVSAEQYGNLITIARADRRRAGATADEIPVVHTPAGGWQGEMPPPVLASCTQPLVAGAPDLRGLWKSVSVEQGGKAINDHPLNQHVERIEQCGDRVVITGGRVIHDMRADGVLEHGVDDVATANLAPIKVAAKFNEGRLELYPGGVVVGQPPIVTREVVDGELILNYVVFKVTMRRVDSK